MFSPFVTVIVTLSPTPTSSEGFLTPSIDPPTPTNPVVRALSSNMTGLPLPAGSGPWFPSQNVIAPPPTMPRISGIATRTAKVPPLRGRTPSIVRVRRSSRVRPDVPSIIQSASQLRSRSGRSRFPEPVRASPGSLEKTLKIRMQDLLLAGPQDLRKRGLRNPEFLRELGEVDLLGELEVSELVCEAEDLVLTARQGASPAWGPDRREFDVESTVFQVSHEALDGRPLWSQDPPFEPPGLRGRGVRQETIRRRESGASVAVTDLQGREDLALRGDDRLQAHDVRILLEGCDDRSRIRASRVDLHERPQETALDGFLIDEVDHGSMSCREIDDPAAREGDPEDRFDHDDIPHPRAG